MRKILIGTLAVLGVGALSFSAMAAKGGGSMFDRVDADQDGVITMEEVNAERGAWFDKIDADGDGAVTRAEADAYREARRAERNPDANKDGVIDREEFLAKANQRFEKMDANADGVLTDDEKPRRRGSFGRRGE